MDEGSSTSINPDGHSQNQNSILMDSGIDMLYVLFFCPKLIQ
ncbi:MAG: hypothetical protein VB047_09070 [Anaerotignum propionicum]|nr:hypothetical protein [Anaerotignum propionicum]MEA5057695.1 hypothetical protein [Anaerotignum propionicum]